MFPNDCFKRLVDTFNICFKWAMQFLIDDEMGSEQQQSLLYKYIVFQSHYSARVEVIRHSLYRNNRIDVGNKLFIARSEGSCFYRFG